MDPHIKKVVQIIVTPSQKYKSFAFPTCFGVSKIESESYSSKSYSAKLHYVLRYSLSGQGKVINKGGKSRMIYPGTILLFEFPSEKYEFIKDANCPDAWVGMYFEFNAGSLKPMIDELIDTYGPIFTPEKDMNIGKKMFQFEKLWMPGKTWFNGNYINMDPIKANSLVLFLLSSIKPFESQAMSINTKFINSICSYINSHIELPLKVGDIARKNHISRGHFTRLFKQHLNISPNHYIRITRLRQICNLILTDDFTHKEIMEKVGIKSLVQYHRLFKQILGITPGEFKKSNDKLEILKKL